MYSEKNKLPFSMSKMTTQSISDKHYFVTRVDNRSMRPCDEIYKLLASGYKLISDDQFIITSSSGRVYGSKLPEKDLYFKLLSNMNHVRKYLQTNVLHRRLKLENIAICDTDINQCYWPTFTFTFCE
jgi:hypothetical protein